MHFKIWTNEDGNKLAIEVNQFLDKHPDLEIVDYKMTTSYYQDSYRDKVISSPQYQVGLFYKKTDTID